MADEKLTVTATRNPIPVSQFGGTVSIISADDIERYQYQDITAVLQGIPGIYLSSSGGYGSQSSLFIRGTESDHVVVLIDGVEVTDPASQRFSFEHLPLHNIERIEILRGPHSAQYGSEALGGIINIITQKAQDEPQISAKINGGSFDSYNGAASISGKYRPFDFSVAANYFHTAGQSRTVRRLRQARKDNDGYENRDFKLNAGIELNPKFRLDGYYGHINADSEYDPSIPPFESDDCRQSTKTERKAIKLSGQTGSWNGYWQATNYHGWSEDTPCSGLPLSEQRSDRDKFEWHNRFQLNRMTQLSIGMETELEAFSNAGQDSARNHALYAEAAVTPVAGMTITGSIRNDDPDDFDSEQSVRIAAAYETHDRRLRLRASYGTGFKAPSLFDRFDPDSGNPELSVEKSDSWEVGIEKELTSGLKIGTVYFENTIRDLIEYDLMANSLTNTGKADIEGLEMFISTALNDAMQVRVDYTLMRAEDSEHHRLLRRPLRAATLHWEWQPHSLYSMAVRVNYTGRRADTRRDTFARVSKGGYTVANVSAQRRINDNVGMVLRIDNLLDKDYEPTDGYQGTNLGIYFGLIFN